MWIFFFFFFFFGGGGGWSYEIGLFFWAGVGVGGGGSCLYIIGRFKVKIQNGNIFGAANFQIFLGKPDIPDFFCGGGGVGGKQSMLGPSLCMKKK